MAHAERVLIEVRHLPGGHDQKSHGRKGGATSTGVGGELSPDEFRKELSQRSTRRFLDEPGGELDQPFVVKVGSVTADVYASANISATAQADAIEGYLSIADEHWPGITQPDVSFGPDGAFNLLSAKYPGESPERVMEVVEKRHAISENSATAMVVRRRGDYGSIYTNFNPQIDDLNLARTGKLSPALYELDPADARRYVGAHEQAHVRFNQLQALNPPNAVGFFSKAGDQKAASVQQMYDRAFENWRADDLGYGRPDGDYGVRMSEYGRTNLDEFAAESVAIARYAPEFAQGDLAFEQVNEMMGITL